MKNMLIALVLLGFALPVAAQQTVEFSLGDVFKRKQQATAAIEMSPFDVWTAGRSHGPIGSCGGGYCSTVTITGLEQQASRAASDELRLLVTEEVETEDGHTGEISRDSGRTEVLCSIQRPEIDGSPVEFFANGQPVHAGSTAERYLLVCHSYEGEVAEGARRFGYPLVPGL